MHTDLAHQAPRGKGSGARMSRERLVHATTTLFAERGYDAVTIADIAAAAGSTRPTVYNHLGDDKYAAYADCVCLAAQDAITFLHHRYERASALTPPEEIAVDMVFFDYVELHPAPFPLLMDTTHDPATPRRDAVIDAITNRVTTQIAKRATVAFKNGSVPRHLAAMTVGVAIHAVREAHRDHPPTGRVRRT